MGYPSEDVARTEAPHAYKGDTVSVSPAAGKPCSRYMRKTHERRPVWERILWGNRTAKHCWLRENRRW